MNYSIIFILLFVIIFASPDYSEAQSVDELKQKILRYLNDSIINLAVSNGSRYRFEGNTLVEETQKFATFIPIAKAKLPIRHDTIKCSEDDDAGRCYDLVIDMINGEKLIRQLHKSSGKSDFSDWVWSICKIPRLEDIQVIGDSLVRLCKLTR